MKKSIFKIEIFEDSSAVVGILIDEVVHNISLTWNQADQFVDEEGMEGIEEAIKDEGTYDTIDNIIGEVAELLESIQDQRIKIK